MERGGGGEGGLKRREKCVSVSESETQRRVNEQEVIHGFIGALITGQQVGVCVCWCWFR